MPRYFITTSDGFEAKDEEGLELPDEAALEKMLTRILADILRDEGRVGGPSEFWAEATDRSGRRVLKLKVSMAKVAP